MQKKILVVDDELIIRESLSSDLKREGYKVEAVVSGEDALLHLQEEKYDLLITDLVMDGMNGLELLSTLRGQDSDMPVIIITGYGELKSAVEALRLGASDYLLKPYFVKELLIRIKNIFQQRELLEKVSLYENILAICCECRKIRDDRACLPGEGKWVSLETYLRTNTDLQLTHGYCPTCGKKRLDEIDAMKSRRAK